MSDIEDPKRQRKARTEAPRSWHSLKNPEHIAPLPERNFEFSSTKKPEGVRLRSASGGTSGGGSGDEGDPKPIPLSRFRQLKKEYPKEFPLFMRLLRALNATFAHAVQKTIGGFPTGVAVPLEFLALALQTVLFTCEACLSFIVYVFYSKGKRTQVALAFGALAKDAISLWLAELRRQFKRGVQVVDAPDATKH